MIHFIPESPETAQELAASKALGSFVKAKLAAKSEPHQATIERLKRGLGGDVDSIDQLFSL